jgi:hypothetical protein
MTWLAGILGAVCGAVVWSMLLRLPSLLAQWLCKPFGTPHRLAMVVSMAFSVIFLGLLAIGVLMTLTLLITSGPTVRSDHDLRVIRGIVFVSSWVGYAVVPIVMRLENSWT